MTRMTKRCLGISVGFGVLSVLIVVVSFGLAHGNPVVSKALFALLTPTFLLYPVFGFSGGITFSFCAFTFLVQSACALAVCFIVGFGWHHIFSNGNANA